MIVKDEKPVIQKCLASIKPLIDYWVIVDTGSTDGTQQVIREFMKGVPGELFERPWIDFGYNRNEALQLAKGKSDYCLIIDADQVLIYPEGFVWPHLEFDLYTLNVHQTLPNGVVGSSPQVFLIKKELDCRWEGCLHEQIRSTGPFSLAFIEDLSIATDSVSGHRSQDPQKYHKDVETLKKGLKAQPENARYQFYLGSTYELAGELELSLEAFQKFLAMKNGSSEERYRAWTQVGMLQKRLKKPDSLFLESLKKAYEQDPARAEAAFLIGGYYFEREDFDHAYPWLKEAAQKALPHCGFVERSIYTWAALHDLSICAVRLGLLREGLQYAEQLLLRSEMPPSFRALAERRYRDLKIHCK